MKWRARVLSELVAGAEIGLLGFDFQPPEVLSALLKGGVLRSGIRPEPGTDVRICVEDILEWRILVPCKGGALAHADGRKAISLSHAEARLHPVDRGGLYRTMVDDLSCRPDIRELAVGIWQLGTFQHPDSPRAKVVIVEQGTPPDTVAQQVQALQYTCIFLLGVGNATESLESLNGIVGKTILHGQLETDGDRFYCIAMDEAEDLATPPRPDTYVDTKAFPPVFVVNGKRFNLPIDKSRPSLGTLLFDYLIENPRQVFSGWELEGNVFPERREKHGIPLGTDDRLSNMGEQQIRLRASELREVLGDESASENEKFQAREELENLSDEMKKAKSPSGNKKQLGSSDAKKAAERVRKALDKVVEVVSSQDPEIGSLLDQALARASTVQFTPPPSWGI